MVICLDRGADLHMAQQRPLPLTVSCFSKIEIGLPSWYRLTRVVPEKGPLNVCVCNIISSQLLLWLKVPIAMLLTNLFSQLDENLKYCCQLWFSLILAHLNYQVIKTQILCSLSATAVCCSPLW